MYVGLSLANSRGFHSVEVQVDSINVAICLNNCDDTRPQSYSFIRSTRQLIWGEWEVRNKLLVPLKIAI